MAQSNWLAQIIKNEEGSPRDSFCWLYKRHVWH